MDDAQAYAGFNSVGRTTFYAPPQSDWQCELFGMGSLGIIFRPRKGKEPNAFWRLMQFLILGNRWRKVA